MTQSGSAMVANRTARHPISPPVSLVSHDSPDAGSAERFKRKNTLQEPSAIKAWPQPYTTFRHSYRSWLDDTGAPTIVQKELMRHASIQTTMNIYGKAMTDSKRRAHSKVVELILKPRKTAESASGDHIVAAVGA